MMSSFNPSLESERTSLQLMLSFSPRDEKFMEFLYAICGLSATGLDTIVFPAIALTGCIIISPFKAHTLLYYK